MSSTQSDTVTITEVEGLLLGASNATFLGHDAGGGAWVYKPIRGERPLWDFQSGSLAHREVASHRISEALGLDIVPETLLSDGPFGEGSAQRFLDEDFEWDPRPLIVAGSSDLWPVALLDVVANNADRKIGHLLREPGKDRIWAIDNGLTFHADDKLRTVLWSFAGLEIPPVYSQSLDSDVVAKAVDGLLAEDEVEALVLRVERLKTEPVHPQPPHDRPPMPWPVW